MQIKTYCPKFSGFYETIWAFQYDDIECSLWDNPRAVPEQIKEYILDNISDYIDNTAYENAVAKSFVENVQCLMTELYLGIVKSIAFEAVISPRTYNFSTDTINITIDCDLPLLIEVFKKHPKAAAYIEATYTSCSGFHSFYENDLNDWLETVEKDIEHKAGSMMELLLSEIKEFDMYEAVKSDICESNFIDYDKLIKDVNENFGTNVKSLSELENFEQVHGKLLSSDERRFLSMLYGVKDTGSVLATKASLIPGRFPEFAN